MSASVLAVDFGFCKCVAWRVESTNSKRSFAGDEFTVVVELSNQHGGYFEFAICPKDVGLTEDCFAENILMTCALVFSRTLLFVPTTTTPPPPPPICWTRSP